MNIKTPEITCEVRGVDIAIRNRCGAGGFVLPLSIMGRIVKGAMMQKEWIFPDGPNNGDIIVSILENRGITGQEAVEEYLSDSPKLAHDPFLLKNMNAAVDRICIALTKKEHICIYGDYDADGVCGVSLMMELLSKLDADYSYYIPSRFDEGYGLNREALEKIKQRNADLIITVDCGSSSYDEIEYAKELGIDVIVTDHHNFADKQISCLLINPKQEDCTYPEKELSGCGVAFKLAQALQRTMPENLTKADLLRMLDLVAIATIGDIVPLTGENRTMVKYGIRMINSGKRPGLSMLIKDAGLKEKEIKSEHVAYVIVPHLNAAGRMLSADMGVRLLSSVNEGDLKEATNNLLKINLDRKRIQDTVLEEAVKQADNLYSDELCIILSLPDAHEGITGIVAGKLKDKYNRPAIIITPTGENKLKGTGRSIEGLNLYDMLNQCRDLFDKFGGHAGACGFTMDCTNLPALRESVRSSVESRFSEDPSAFRPRLRIDAETGACRLNGELISYIEKMEPFGHKNSRPVFMIRGVFLSELNYMGERQQHVRFSADGIQCVLFNRADRFKESYEPGKPMDLAGYPEINRWNGCDKIQFTIADFREGNAAKPIIFDSRIDKNADD